MRKVLGLDIETTGLVPGEHRIIEYHGAMHDETGKRLSVLDVRIHPERSIQAEAQRVHGISLADLEGCENWNAVGPRVHAQMADADIFVAHNGDGFDLPFLNFEFKRIGLTEIKTPVVDTMLQGRWATPQGKVPNLGELCFATGVDYDATIVHAASRDVQVMMTAFFRALKWGFFKLPELETA